MATKKKQTKTKAMPSKSKDMPMGKKEMMMSPAEHKAMGMKGKMKKAMH